MAENSAASNPTSAADQENGRGDESGEGNAQSANTIEGGLLGSSRLRTSIGGRNDEGENDEEDPVVQSVAMLRFGAEVPAFYAEGKYTRTVQFPIPDDWNDPEVMCNLENEGEW